MHIEEHDIELTPHEMRELKVGNISHSEGVLILRPKDMVDPGLTNSVL